MRQQQKRRLLLPRAASSGLWPLHGDPPALALQLLLLLPLSTGLPYRCTMLWVEKDVPLPVLLLLPACRSILL